MKQEIRVPRQLGGLSGQDRYRVRDRHSQCLLYPRYAVRPRPSDEETFVFMDYDTKNRHPN